MLSSIFVVLLFGFSRTFTVVDNYSSFLRRQSFPLTPGLLDDPCSMNTQSYGYTGWILLRGHDRTVSAFANPSWDQPVFTHLNTSRNITNESMEILVSGFLEKHSASRFPDATRITLVVIKPGNEAFTYDCVARSQFSQELISFVTFDAKEGVDYLVGVVPEFTSEQMTTINNMKNYIFLQIPNLENAFKFDIQFTDVGPITSTVFQSINGDLCPDDTLKGTTSLQNDSDMLYKSFFRIANPFVTRIVVVKPLDESGKSLNQEQLSDTFVRVRIINTPKPAFYMGNSVASCLPSIQEIVTNQIPPNVNKKIMEYKNNTQPSILSVCVPQLSLFAPYTFVGIYSKLKINFEITLSNLNMNETTATTSPRTTNWILICLTCFCCFVLLAVIIFVVLRKHKKTQKQNVASERSQLFANKNIKDMNVNYDRSLSHSSSSDSSSDFSPDNLYL